MDKAKALDSARQMYGNKVTDVVDLDYGELWAIVIQGEFGALPVIVEVTREELESCGLPPGSEG